MLPGMSENLCLRIITHLQSQIRAHAIACEDQGRGAVVVTLSDVPSEQVNPKATLAYLTLETFRGQFKKSDDRDHAPTQIAKVMDSADSDEIAVIVAVKEQPQYAMTIARD